MTSRGKEQHLLIAQTLRVVAAALETPNPSDQLRKAAEALKAAAG